MTVAFKRATRAQVKLKLGIQGPSGSGKTLGALALARGLVGASGKIALIDTENGSASLYADRDEFDVLELGPPYTSARYLEALASAVEAGYDVAVIDSLSHQWAGAGGVLSRKEQADTRGGNSYTNWAPFSREHGEFVAQVLALPIHVVATLRAKQDYVLTENDRGKQVPKKVGMAPVQREGMEYEFSVVFELQMDHRATASKDRSGLFDGKSVDLLDRGVPAALADWLSTGAPMKPGAPTELTPPVTFPYSPHKGVPLRAKDTDGRYVISVTALRTAAQLIERGMQDADENLLARLIRSAEGIQAEIDRRELETSAA